MVFTNLNFQTIELLQVKRENKSPNRMLEAEETESSTPTPFILQIG